MLMLSTLGSDELTVLLVATGELETLPGRLLTLYIDDAGTFVTSGRRFPVMPRLISYTRKINNCVIITRKTFRKYCSCESDHRASAPCFIYSELVRKSLRRISDVTADKSLMLL